MYFSLLFVFLFFILKYFSKIINLIKINFKVFTPQIDYINEKFWTILNKYRSKNKSSSENSETKNEDLLEKKNYNAKEVTNDDSIKSK